MTLVEGANGQGKSNLIEAIYLLVIAKSLRASSDRELVLWQQSTEEEIYTQLIASVERTSGPVKVQVVFKSLRAANDGNSSTNNILLSQPKNIQKFVRVNDIPRKASELIGEVTAVMFTAMDLELVFGSPSIRRRYLDILISQFDRRYLRCAQRYQRIISQRNHLLKSIARRHSSAEELEFWNKELLQRIDSDDEEETGLPKGVRRVPVELDEEAKVYDKAKCVQILTKLYKANKISPNELGIKDETDKQASLRLHTLERIVDQVPVYNKFPAYADYSVKPEKRHLFNTYNS